MAACGNSTSGIAPAVDRAVHSVPSDNTEIFSQELESDDDASKGIYRAATDTNEKDHKESYDDDSDTPMSTSESEANEIKIMFTYIRDSHGCQISRLLVKSRRFWSILGYYDSPYLRPLSPIPDPPLPGYI